MSALEFLASGSDARLLRPVSSRTSEMTRRRMQPLNLSSLGQNGVSKKTRDTVSVFVGRPSSLFES